MCFSYPALEKFFTQKSALTLGQVGIILSLFGIALFNKLDHGTLTIVSMILFLGFFQFSIGPITFIHIFETNVDSITGFANQVLWIIAFLTSFVTPTLIANLTVSGTFAFFGTSSLFFLFYTACFVKNTSRFEVDSNGLLRAINLTEK